MSREHRSLLQGLVAAVWTVLVPSLLRWRLLPVGARSMTTPPALFQRHTGLCVTCTGSPLTEVQQCWATLHPAFKLLQTQVEKLVDLLILLLYLPGTMAHVLWDLRNEQLPKVLTELSPDAGFSFLSQLYVKDPLCPQECVLPSRVSENLADIVYQA